MSQPKREVLKCVNLSNEVPTGEHSYCVETLEALFTVAGPVGKFNHKVTHVCHWCPRRSTTLATKSRKRFPCRQNYVEGSCTKRWASGSRGTWSDTPGAKGAIEDIPGAKGADARGFSYLWRLLFVFAIGFTNSETSIFRQVFVSLTCFVLLRKRCCVNHQHPIKVKQKFQSKLFISHDCCYLKVGNHRGIKRVVCFFLRFS